VAEGGQGLRRKEGRRREEGVTAKEVLRRTELQLQMAQKGQKEGVGTAGEGKRVWVMQLHG
jgi:hypothetical protein